MADVQMLSAYADFMHGQVKSFNAKGGKLDAKQVLWYIKAWTKIGEVASGGSTYRKNACLKYNSKGTPDKPSMKDLQNVLAGYSDKVDKSSDNATDLGPGATAFDNVDKAMLNVVWGFFRQIASNKVEDTRLVGDIRTWQGLSHDQVMQAEVFPVDRHG